MMDLTASEHHLRCDRIRDLDVARQPATVRRAVEILQAERTALTGVTRGSTKPVGHSRIDTTPSPPAMTVSAPTCTTANRIAVRGAR